MPIFPAERDSKLIAVFMIAFSISIEYCSSPNSLTIIAAAPMHARGLITFLSVYFGADPPIGSNIDIPSGLIFPPAAIPIPP